MVYGSFVAQAAEPQNAGINRDLIRKALDYQRANYPVSQYRDVYKNFMQDYFGPGHLLTDTAASGRYLRKELSETKVFDGPLFEPTGFNGNFYRVNLGLVADGTIPYEIFFNTFVESVKDIVPPEGDEWMAIWNTIDAEIINSGWYFDRESEDRMELSSQFARGDYVVHHSEAYEDSVNFHYRIIERERFNEIIMPLIENKDR